MGKSAERIAAKVANIITNEGGDTSSAESASASEASVTAPPARGASEAESGSAAGAVTSADGDEDGGASGGSDAEVRNARLSLLAEKTKALRESRRAKKTEGRFSERQKELDERQKKIDAEATKYEGLRNGTFLETIKGLGKDPQEVFKEMVAEAKRQGTPEAQIAMMRDQFSKQLNEAVEPLKQSLEEERKKRQELEDDHKKRIEAQENEVFAADFDVQVKAPDWVDLRVEYGDKRLLRLVSNLKSDPDAMRAHAKELGVKLTYPDRRFTMKDILSVLKAAHVAHETEKKQRRDQMQAPTSSQGAPQQAPANARTVNGTAEKRNAGTNPLGNDSAASKASAPGGRPRLSRQARIDRAMTRDAARRG